MTRREIAAKLREALRLMNDTGAHWTQGDYQQEIDYDEDSGETVYAWCSLGAIRYVTDTEVEEPSAESDELALALAAVLPRTLAEERAVSAVPRHETDLSYDRIVDWNDADERNWKDIVEKFTEVADRLEAAEGSTR